MTTREPGTGRLLIAFEGLDQSGKETQARRLRQWFEARGRAVESLDVSRLRRRRSGRKSGTALHGERDFGPDTIQLLLHGEPPRVETGIQSGSADGRVVICDRYLASSVAYGEAQGLDPALARRDPGVPAAADVTVLLDIAPGGRGGPQSEEPRQVREDLPMLGRVRASYLRQAADQSGSSWTPRARSTVVAADVAQRRGDATRATVSARTSARPPPAARARTRPAWRRSCSRRPPAPRRAPAGAGPCDRAPQRGQAPSRYRHASANAPATFVLPRSGVQFDLGRVVARAPERVAHRAGRAPREQRGLVEAARVAAPPVQRHRHAPCRRRASTSRAVHAHQRAEPRRPASAAART